MKHPAMISIITNILLENQNNLQIYHYSLQFNSTKTQTEFYIPVILLHNASKFHNVSVSRCLV